MNYKCQTQCCLIMFCIDFLRYEDFNRWRIRTGELNVVEIFAEMDQNAAEIVVDHDAFFKLQTLYMLYK